MHSLLLVVRAFTEFTGLYADDEEVPWLRG